MKGRHTSFQRFGSGSHNPFGSVLNKYSITSDLLRKNDIYEKTGDGASFKNDDQEDLGEEVYGCIAKGINTQGHLESNYQDMQAERKTRDAVEQYALGSKKEAILRTWEGKNKRSFEDSSLVPQESIPLNVISKYPIKFSYDAGDAVKTVDVPPSAGFSGPYLYRPSKFPSSFTPTIVKEDCIINSAPYSSIKIPTDVAHQMLNCTKEIKLTGEVDHSTKVKNKECSGQPSRTVTQNYYEQPLCPGSPVAKSKTATYQCTSVSQETELMLKGEFSGTLSRYNLISSLWGEPVKLDLSANIYEGSNADKAYNFSVVKTCNAAFPNQAIFLDQIKVKILGEREKVTSLDAGCAVVQSLDLDIVKRDAGENLLSKEGPPLGGSGGANYCTKIVANLKTQGLEKKVVLHSGPSLFATYSAGVAQYVGLEEEEKLFKETACSGDELEMFRTPKGAALETGLELSMKGKCDNGLALGNFGISLFNDDDGGNGECKPCGEMGEPKGEYGLICEKTKQCYSFYSQLKGESGDGYESKCAVPFSASLSLGRYVQTKEDLDVESSVRHVQAELLPLNVQAEYTEQQDLCLSFVFSTGTTAYPQGGDIPLIISPMPVISTCKKWHESFPESELHDMEILKVGSLKLKSGEWSEDVPLYAAHFSLRATECTGTDIQWIGDHSGWVLGCSEPTTPGYCDEPPGCECCGGYNCGDLTFEDAMGCTKTETCYPIPCVYSYSSSFTASEQCLTPECSGCRECGPKYSGTTCTSDGRCAACDCCGCNCNCKREDGSRGPPTDPCPPRQELPPTTYSGTGELGCYGTAHETFELKTSVNITMEFIPFKEAI